MRWGSLLGIGAVAGLLAGASPAVAATKTFLYTGSEQTFSVPAGDSSIQVALVGGRGGNGSAGGVGSFGASVQTPLTVTPGETLYIEVAGNGGSSSGSGGAGGFNGGGDGDLDGGGGGGASDIRTSPLSTPLGYPDPRLVVAAGGGGAAGGNRGGTGGIPSGAQGGYACGGGGAFQNQGGVGRGGSSQAGTQGQGGNGGTGGGSSSTAGGGGGGGGYFGGGGGSDYCNDGAGGGGGGSSFGPSGTTYVLDTTGTPSVTITYTAPPSISITRPANGGRYIKGAAVTAAYSCTADSGATLTTCSGPVASGAALDTSTLGQHSFTVQAEDNSGRVSSRTVTYTIVTPPAPSISGLAFTGSRFRFSLNERAEISLWLRRLEPGRRVGEKCVPPSRTNQKDPRCTRRITVDKVTVDEAKGQDTIGSGRLAPGHYVVTISASAAGQRATKSLAFSVS